MQESAFKAMHDAEAGWWYDARMFGVKRILERMATHDETICDVGAGYGAMIPALQPFGSVAAFEPDEARRQACARTYPGTVGHGDFAQFILESVASFSLVTLYDVVEHVEDDVAFLKNIARTLRPKGHIFISVPALQLLWSDFDVRNGHYRRYTRKHIERVVRAAGFEIEYATYWNMMLLIPTLLVRRSSGAGAVGLPRILDRMFYWWVRFETLCMPFISLPIGTSVFVYARKTN